MDAFPNFNIQFQIFLSLFVGLFRSTVNEHKCQKSEGNCGEDYEAFYSPNLHGVQIFTF